MAGHFSLTFSLIDYKISKIPWLFLDFLDLFFSDSLTFPGFPGIPWPVTTLLKSYYSKQKIYIGIYTVKWLRSNRSFFFYFTWVCFVQIGAPKNQGGLGLKTALPPPPHSVSCNMWTPPGLCFLRKWIKLAKNAFLNIHLYQF